ncbi:FIG00638737: hypothetical protein [hydrothermal vent metagenome]|uniref:Uncharacterized protein n=1 Tax=hydrothermal vent metagenome TaxID=652676 RepID=A0A3B0Y3J3_9ZZZZ
MSKLWSKLQKELYLLRAKDLKLQVHCRRYRMKSQYGSTDFPRYWITLGKEVIWDYPKDFQGKRNPNWADSYPYNTDISNISELIREYIDTPKTELMKTIFASDHWGLINILRAADKRIGQRRIPDLMKKTNNIAARKVIRARMMTAK